MEKFKLITMLALQLITFGVGVLTTFGVTLDPAQVEAFKATVSDFGAQAVGIALIVSAMSTSAKDLFGKIRDQLSGK